MPDIRKKIKILLFLFSLAEAGRQSYQGSSGLSPCNCCKELWRCLLLPHMRHNTVRIFANG